MPLIKGSSRKSVSENIKTELASGKKRDQAIAIALDVARRAKRASGGGVDEEDMPVVPRVSDPTERVLEKDVLAKPRKKNAAAEYLAANPQVRQVLEDRMARGYGMFQPVFDIADAIKEPTLGTITKAATTVPAYFGKLLPAMGALGGGYGIAAMKDLGVFGSDAEAQTRAQSRERAKAADAEARAAREKAAGDRLTIDAQSKANKDASDTRIREEEAARLRRRQEAESSEYDRAVMEAEDARAQALKRDRRFSDTAVGKVYEKTGGVEGLMAPIAAGMVHRAGVGPKAGVFNSYVAPYLEGSVAAYGANTLPLYYDAYRTESYNPRKEAYDEYSLRLPPGHPRKTEMATYAKGLPDKNPVQAEAQRELSDGFLKRLMMSGAEGFGAILGTKAANVPRRMGETIGNVVEDVAAIPGRAAKGWATSQQAADEAVIRGLGAARDVERSRAASAGERSSVAGESQHQRNGSQLADEAAGLEAGAGTGPMGSRPVSPEAGPVSEPGLMDRIRQNRELGDRLRADADAANPAVGAKTPSNTPLANPAPTKRQPPLNRKGHDALEGATAKLLDEGRLPADFTPNMYLDKMSNVKVDPARVEQHIAEVRQVAYALEAAGLRDATPQQIKAALDELRRTGVIAPPKRASGGEVEQREHHSHFQPRKIGRFAGGPVYRGAKDSPRKPMERRATGVDVDAALSTARKYASGGAVHAGPVPGETTGRSDELPIDVEAGSFVIPADIVSALGDGNSEAGYVHLDKVFGQGRPRLARGGAAVPIKISHGEYVVPPETVARIGKGDMDMGHRSLDKFVLGVRKQNIHKLSKLPPPAR